MGYIRQNKLKLLSFSLFFGFTALNVILIKQALIINTSSQEILSKLSNTNQFNYNDSTQLKSDATLQGSMSSAALNGFSTKTPSEQPINQALASELVALIQSTIKDELYSLRYTADSKSNSCFSDKDKSDADSNKTNPLLSTAINSNHDVEFDDNASVIAEDEVTAIIEGAISHGVWSIEDNEQLMEASLHLKPEAKRRIREKLMTAINNQELTMRKNALIVF